MNCHFAPRNDSPSPENDEQTLRAVMEWSYGLLNEQARALFNRLSVFVGGFTLDAAESYSGSGFLDVMSLLAQLVNASLVSAQASNSGQARYRLPETIRQFALEKLRASGEEEATRRNHRDGFLMLAIQAEPNLHGGQ